jgi:hypothetical protein
MTSKVVGVAGQFAAVGQYYVWTTIRCVVVDCCCVGIILNGTFSCPLGFQATPRYHPLLSTFLQGASVRHEKVGNLLEGLQRVLLHKVNTFIMSSNH